jgi:hypothetical protein
MRASQVLFFNLQLREFKMQVKPSTHTLALLAVLFSMFLTACGGGGGGGGGDTAIVTPPVLTFSYKTTSLVGSPSFVLSPTVTINSATTTGTVTLVGGTVTDVIGYTLNTTTGVLTPASPYTVAGDLGKAWLMVCKPLQSVDGNVNFLDVGPKSIYVAMPDTATLGTIDDVRDKTFDTYENCATTTLAAGVLFSSALLALPNNIALFSPTGLVQRSGTLPNITTDVSRLVVYKAGGKVFLVARTVKTPANENTWGALAIWVSR